MLPTPAEVAAATPPNRDRVIDVIRIFSLLGVVLGHTVMAVSTIRDGVFIWENLLTSVVAFQWLTWILQVMPLFFFAGTAACVDSWKPGGQVGALPCEAGTPPACGGRNDSGINADTSSWGGWLMQRCTRLYRPVFYYLAFWGVALVVLRIVLPTHVYEPVAGISIQLLWFIGVYVLVLATIPLLTRITTTARLAASVIAVYCVVVVVDILRLTSDGLSALGFVNLVAWLIPGMLGVGYRRGLVSRRAALVVAAAMFAVNLMLVSLGPYEVSLVGLEGLRLTNMFPPSALLAGHAIVLSALAIAVAPVIARWAQRVRVWWLVAIGNSGAMTLYLWHMPALLGMHLVFDALGMPRYDVAEPGFLLLSVVQLVTMVLLVGVAFVALRPLENNPLPGWDGGFVAGRGPRSAVVGMLLCVAATATLFSVKSGLKGEGLVCIAVLLAALIAARALATDSRVPVGA